MNLVGFRKNFTVLAIFFLIVTLINLLGCNIDIEDAKDAKTYSDFRVAILLAGSIDDHSWNQAGYEAIKLVEEKLKANISYTENVTAETAVTEARKYAVQGYDFVILHGGEYVEPAQIVAKEFPRTKFAVNGFYSGNNSNLGAITFRFGEMGYLTGLIAGMKTKTKHIAYMVGDDFPQYVEEAVFFEKAAKSVDPNIKVSIRYLHTWIDPNKATQTALELVSQGVDIISINTDHPGVTAIKEIAKYPQVLIIGRDQDQHDVAPGKVITSVINDSSNLILRAATLVQQGRWEGKQYKFGLREDIFNFAPFRNHLTPEQIEKFNNISEEIRSGNLDTSSFTNSSSQN
ncbi:MAG: BMP family protein [Blastocatellia bacterium]|nr:BMP family protein [Blastocatellia bacterium]